MLFTKKTFASKYIRIECYKEQRLEELHIILVLHILLFYLYYLIHRTENGKYT